MYTPLSVAIKALHQASSVQSSARLTSVPHNLDSSGVFPPLTSPLRRSSGAVGRMAKLR